MSTHNFETNRVVTNSSTITRLQYSPTTATLRATFGESTYEYDAVEPEVAALGFTTADSVGKWFNAAIKTRGYKYRKVELIADHTDLSQEEYLAKVARGTKA